MKKIYYISIAILFVIFLTTIFLPFYKPLYFFTKHISLFLLVSLIFIGVLKRYYNRLDAMFNSRKYIVRSLTVIAFGLLIFGFSEVQMLYIDTFETPEVDGCSYYDSYGNLIYDTILPMNCGEIEVITNTPSKLEITVVERMSDEYQAGYTGNNELYPLWGDSFSGVKKTDITVTYDSEGRILTVSLLSSTNYEIIDNESLYSYNPYIYYNSFKRVVVNEYFEDSFKSTQKVYVLEDIVGSWSQLDEITHYDFSEDESVTEILESSIFSMDTGEFKIFKVTKETIVDGDVTTETIATGYFIETGTKYTNKITYNVHINEEGFQGENRYVVSPGEGSFKETHEMSGYDLYYAVEYENYREIKNLQSIKSFELIDQDISYIASNSYTKLGNRIYTDIGTNSLGIIDQTEFGFKISYYGLPDGFLSKDTQDTRWKIDMLSMENNVGGKYNLYKIFDYEEYLIDTYIYSYIVYEENPLISIYYD